ncbi:MAG TPA: dodecin family protein [Chloroflexota bacterium]|nr:dodecin family protein [Chloroflexota bacterium]
MAMLKVIEVVGLSADGWEAAARAVVTQASRSVQHIESLEVTRCTAVVRQDAILEYRLHAKLTFRVEDDVESDLAVEAVQTILAAPAAENEELPSLLERQIDQALEETESDARP